MANSDVTVTVPSKADLVRWIMAHNGLTAKDASDLLGKSVTYFHNKLYRNSFSFEEMVWMLHLCGYHIIFDNEEGGRFFLNAEALVENSAPDLYRVCKEEKEILYHRLKEEAKKLNDRFHFK